MLILELHQLDKSLAPLDERILVAKAKSWEDHLTHSGLPVERYEEVYSEAMRHYTDKAPFSVFDLLRAWKEIQERFTWVDGDGNEHVFDPGEDRRKGISEASIERTKRMFESGMGRYFRKDSTGELRFYGWHG